MPPRYREVDGRKDFLDSQILHGSERDQYGVTVTIERNHIRKSLVGQGKALDALRDVCQRIDQLGGGWRVISISTPNTVYRDIVGGSRARVQARSVEQMLLGRLGRLDLSRTSDGKAK